MRILHHRRHFIAIGALLLGITTHAGGVHAKPKQRKLQFLLSIAHVTPPPKGDKAPATLAATVKRDLVSALKAHPRFLTALPSDAPNPEKQPGDFQAYLKKHRIRAYRVRVEITQFATELSQTETANHCTKKSPQIL